MTLSKRSILFSSIAAIGLYAAAYASFPAEEQPVITQPAAVAEQTPVAVAAAEEKKSIPEAAKDLVNAVAAEGKPIEQDIRHAVEPVMKEAERIVRDDVKPALKDAEKDVRDAVEPVIKGAEETVRDDVKPALKDAEKDVRHAVKPVAKKAEKKVKKLFGKKDKKDKK